MQIMKVLHLRLVKKGEECKDMTKTLINAEDKDASRHKEPENGGRTKPKNAINSCKIPE